MATDIKQSNNFLAKILALMEAVEFDNPDSGPIFKKHVAELKSITSRLGASHLNRQSNKWVLDPDGFIHIQGHSDLILDIEGGGGAGTKVILWDR